MRPCAAEVNSSRDLVENSRLRGDDIHHPRVCSAVETEKLVFVAEDDRAFI